MRNTIATASRAARAALLASTILAAASAAQAQDAQPTDDSASQAAGGEADIVVTGSRIARRGVDAPTPVTVLGSEELQQFSQTNVADSLNRIPSFRAQVTPATSQFSSANVGQQTLDLRGLGSIRTLVLIDGRRFVPASIAGTVDLNLIPSLLVERSEVVTGGASAAYGSDAVAGVVNILLDHDLEGFRAQLQAGVSEEGDGEEYLAGLAWGTSFAGGAGKIVVGVEYVDSNGVGDCLSRDWCKGSFRVLPNAAFRTNGLPANVITGDTRYASGAPGGLILSGPLTGQQFRPDGTLAPFQFGDLRSLIAMRGGEGTYNYFGPPFIKLVAATERLSTYAHAELELGASTTAFVDASYGWSQGFNFGPQMIDLGRTVIRSDNAFLSDAVRAQLTGVTQFNLGRVGNDFGPARWTSTTEVYRIATGLQGAISDAWTWDVYYQYGQTDYEFLGENQRINANYERAVDSVRNAAGSIVCRVNADTNPANDDPACVPLNVIGEGNYSAAAKAYAFGSSNGTLDYVQHVAAANIQGDLFELPGGSFTVAGGLEYRRDRASGTSDPISRVIGFLNGSAPAYNGRIGTLEVYEGYVEAAAPLIADAPFARLLELNGAVRRTHYNNSGWVTTWKAGAIWAPTDWLRFRGTRSRDIRAPNIGNLYQPGTQTFAAIRNPTTLEERLTPLISGGNPDLQPEVSDTWTVGLGLTPDGALRGLRFSADYYDIQIDDVIANLGGQLVVNRCFSGLTEFCGSVERDAAGVIQRVFDRPFNLNRMIVRGIDFELGYDVPLDRLFAGASGRLSLGSYATYLDSLTTVDQSGAINRAGQTGMPYSAVSGLPHWTVYNTVAWTGETLGLALAHRWIEGGKYDATLIGPEDPGYASTLPNSINTNRVAGRHYFDLTARFFPTLAGSDGFEFYLTVTNLFDRDPPLAPGTSGAHNPALFDPIGRRFRAGVRARF